MVKSPVLQNLEIALFGISIPHNIPFVNKFLLCCDNFYKKHNKSRRIPDVVRVAVHGGECYCFLSGDS